MVIHALKLSSSSSGGDIAARFRNTGASLIEKMPPNASSLISLFLCPVNPARNHVSNVVNFCLRGVFGVESLHHGWLSRGIDQGKTRYRRVSEGVPRAPA